MMRDRRSKIRSALIVLLLCAGSVCAQPQMPPLIVNVHPPTEMDLQDLTDLALQRNPRLQQVALEIDAVQGRVLQASLYPNPQVTLSGEEIGSRGGIHTLPQVSTPIVTANKIQLATAVALREVNQAQLSLYQQRFVLLTEVRRGYVDVLELQLRLAVLTQMIKLARQSYENANQLLQGKIIAELDVLPFEVRLRELEAELQAAQREKQARLRQLGATIGVPDFAVKKIAGSLTGALPEYDFDQAKDLLVKAHPAIVSAEVGIHRAQLVVQREQARGVPNFSVGVGYQHNFNEHVNQATYQVQIPIPLFNRNQGNVRSAQAQLAQSAQEVDRIRYLLTGQLATAFGEYAAAKQRVDLYRESILPKADRSYELAIRAFRGGQFQYLRVLQAQNILVDSRLRYVELLAEAWRAASVISGLLLEEQWPPQKMMKGEE